MDKNTILEIKDLNISIPMPEGMLTPVRGVNFDMKKGETVGLVGESGCGKSLTCRAILAINEKKCKAAGSILYNSDEKGEIDLLKLDPCDPRQGYRDDLPGAYGGFLAAVYHR